MKERLEQLIAMYKEFLKKERSKAAQSVLRNVVEDLQSIVDSY